MDKKTIIGLLVVIVVLVLGFSLFGKKTDDASTNLINNPEAAAVAEEARVVAAGELGMEAREVTVQGIYANEWPDACLGLAQEDEMCAQVITPGYEVVLEAGEETLTYRTDETGNVIIQAN